MCCTTNRWRFVHQVVRLDLLGGAVWCDATDAREGGRESEGERRRGEERERAMGGEGERDEREKAGGRDREGGR